MRIGIDINPMVLSRGGMGQYTRRLVEHLLGLDTGDEFFLYNTSGRDYLPDGFLKASRIRRFWRPLSPWMAGRDRIDLYHGTSYKLWATGRLGGVVTVHDLALHRFPGFSKRLFGERLSQWKTRRALQKAVRVIAVSENTARDLCSVYGLPREKIRVVYNGVGEEFYPRTDPVGLEAVRRRYGIPDRDYLFYVGGTGPRKNLERLLRAFAELDPKRYQVRLVLAGRGVARYLGPLSAQLNLTRRVVFLDYVDPEDLPFLYSGARVFVYPSLYEGFGLPIVEAMACGVPVVTSNGSSLVEIAGDAACLVDPLRVEEISEAMGRVLEDEPLRAGLVNRGLVRSKAFSWDKTAKETLAVYHEAAG